MNKLLVLTGVALSISSVSATAAEYKPTFEVDYGECGGPPVVSGNSVTFGIGPSALAGRVVSTKRYQNITQVEATVNVSELGQDFVNAAFYMVANPTDPGKQPKGQNYCDAGGNKSEWNCRELDFIETNGNKITQTSMHLGNGGISAPQRWEFSFAETAKADNCFNYQNMLSSPTPTNGLHSLVGGINLKRPFNVRTTFSYGSPPSMRTTFIQSGSSVVVYDTAVGTGAEGSKLNSFGELIPTMKDGY